MRSTPSLRRFPNVAFETVPIVCLFASFVCYCFDEIQRAIVNQMNTGTVSKATLGKLLRDGVEHIWAFLST